jgi:hypothetical protein
MPWARVKRLASRGVVRKECELRAMRELVSRDRAILAVDLASQRQAAVVCDHDSVVLGRRMFTGSASCISEILAWEGPVAEKARFAGLVLAWEPTRHRWKPLVVTAGGIPQEHDWSRAQNVTVGYVGPGRRVLCPGGGSRHAAVRKPRSDYIAWTSMYPMSLHPSPLLQ